ncbi:MAG: ATP synthase F1 subunit delta [Gemmatales bacterium]|nr:ATP synthase F1 subunit delta [Gemmatales bacterium]MDW8386963.1 ATP synthase F1 subunit delta [Gemmatales bacterium]
MSSQPSTNHRAGFRDLITDVGALRVAKVYAEALLNAAEKRNQAQEIWEELDSLVTDIFAAKPELEVFLSSGAIGRNAKENVLRKVFEGRASELFLNFLMVLNRHDRLNLLRAVRQSYRDLMNARARRIVVQVRTAAPMEEDQRQRLIDNIRESLHLEPVLEERVDPDLLGGLVLRVGDQMFDGSVRTRLLKLREKLRERSSHEIQSRRDRFSA